MTNAAVYIRWGRQIPGREGKSLEVFSQAVEYYGSLKSKGTLSDFRVYFATNGNLADFGGFMLLEGEVSKLRTVVDGEEYQSLMVKAHLVVDQLDIVHLSTGDEIQKTLGRGIDARKQLGIG
jgi:hypothetical protein